MTSNVHKFASSTLAILVVGIAVLLLNGCSSFNVDWEKTAQMQVPYGSMVGRWKGHWLSDINGHNGELLCIVSPKYDDEVSARFRATYKTVFHFSYTVPLTVEQTNGIWHFRGQENLGKLAGGVYEYEGTATATNFHSTYRSKYDHGVFEMTRPIASDD